ncbi:hypothetical protein ACPOL_0468 [Acidisarcina polymorpha]|uniref:Uncharacterized protein n=1 Tax=Acidisarcina polymorpha TaxID=2211140 RepID=A0A2Z5FTT3_9BACT|nr:hypothetical protein ACPOL_0468 [Acidisarcina polymorpha]
MAFCFLASALSRVAEQLQASLNQLVASQGGAGSEAGHLCITP